MMLISSLGLDNSELPGKAKLFAFIFSTPRACFLKFLLAQQCTFLDHFCRHLRANNPPMKGFRSLCLHHHRNHLCPFIPQFWNFSRKILIFFNFHSFLFPPQSILCYWQIWQHLCLLIPQFGPLAVIHYMFEHWIPSKTWSFLFSFRLNLHFSARTQWIAPATLSFLVFDSGASFGHEHRIWLTVSASALPLVNLCFHVIST